MKKIFKMLFSLLFCIALLTFSACKPPDTDGPGTPDPNVTEIIPEGYAKIRTDEPYGNKVAGIGAECDPHFFSQNAGRSGGPKEEDWNIVVSRVKEMQLHRVRVQLLPEWLEPLNDDSDPQHINWDALTPESIEMRSLYKLLDLCEEENIDVNLTLWGANRMVKLQDTAMNNLVGGVHFLAAQNSSSNWTVGPKNAAEFAENFSMFVQLLIIQKGYTCIKEVTPINEPSWTYLIDGRIDFDMYADMCKELHRRFKADGIRDKVKFNLSDDAESLNWLQKSADSLSETADGEDLAEMWNSHTYMFGYETKNSVISDWETKNMTAVRASGKPHMLGEFGSNKNIGSTRQTDIGEYSRGVLMTRIMLNAFNNGASAMSHWTLYDQYYNRSADYSEMMQLGFWASTKEEYKQDSNLYASLTKDFQIRPAYYAYSLMTKHVKRGAEVTPFMNISDFVCGTAFKNPDGKWVYAFANGGTEESTIAIRNGANYGDFDVYVYAEGGLPSGDAGIVPSGQKSFENQTIPLNIAPQTVVMLVQK